MVFQVLGIDLHPELLDLYFGNYERVLYLAQVAEPELVAAAHRAADRLGLPLVIEATGYGQLAGALEIAGPSPMPPGTLPASKSE